MVDKDLVVNVTLVTDGGTDGLMAVTMRRRASGAAKPHHGVCRLGVSKVLGSLGTSKS